LLAVYPFALQQGKSKQEQAKYNESDGEVWTHGLITQTSRINDGATQEPPI